MDALIAFGDHSSNTQQSRALSSPVARRAGTVFLACEHYQRYIFPLVAHGRVINAHLIARRDVSGIAALRIRRKRIAQAYVGKGTAHHDLVIAAARSIRVEVGGLYAAFLEVFTRGAIGFDRACR